jgi:arylsulfatase A-like enzyme
MHRPAMRAIETEFNHGMRNLTFAILAMAALGCAQSEVPRFERPPIIIVDIDTLRADHLGCYGYHRSTSPNIDAFSRESALFLWAFAQAPNTPPSQASILTGLYPTSHGRIGNEGKMPDSVVTLAEVLQAEGYGTGAFVDGGLMVAGFGLEQGFDVYDDSGGRLRAIGPKAARWIRHRLASPEVRDDPFLLLIHSFDTHSPYEVTPEPHRSAFLAEVTTPRDEFRHSPSTVMGAVWKARWEHPPPSLSADELAYAVALYDGGIRHVDTWFSGFISFLKEVGIYDQSIIVFISDHGDEFQEHGGLFHERLYTTVTRIPFMMRLPGQAHRGAYHQVVQSIDLVPTLLETVGVEGPPGVQGRSLLPLMQGEQEHSELAVSESPYFGRRIAVTSPDYRLFYTASRGSFELYRYREDPTEQDDLAGDDPDQSGQLIEHVRRWQQVVEAARVGSEQGRELSEIEKDQLRTLGYLE